MAEEKKEDKSKNSTNDSGNKEGYYFGGITEYRLEDIEAEVLNDNVYLDVFAGSDERFKKDMTSLNGALDDLSKLRALKYRYKTTEFKEKNFPNDEQIGFKAQDLEKLFPHLVKHDEEGYKHVNYAGLTPVLVQGLQELLAVNERQAEVIQSLSEAIKRLEAKVEGQEERSHS